jgi:hypothetical protein
MTISLHSSDSVEATSITLPSHAAGDTIIIIASRLTNNTAISNSDTSLALFRSNAGQAQRHTVYRKIAQSSSETVGTFTNAELITALVFRTDQSDTAVFLNNVNLSSGNSTTLSFGAVADFTGVATDQRVVGFGAIKNTAATMSTSPTGMSNVLTDIITGLGAVGVHLSPSNQASWSSQTAVVSAGANPWAAITFELFEASIYVPAGGGGGFRAVNIRGGADQ